MFFLYRRYSLHSWAMKKICRKPPQLAAKSINLPKNSFDSPRKRSSVAFESLDLDVELKRVLEESVPEPPVERVQR